MTSLVTENLALLANAPNGIPGLRQLILRLAVRGSLLTQDPTDPPADRELAMLADARSKATSNKARNSRDAVRGSVEPSHFIPTSWRWCMLADVVQVLNGRAYKKEELLESGTPVLRVGNLFTSNHWYYSNLSLEDDKYCEPGDLIFAWSASFGPFIWTGQRVIYHYHIWKLKPHAAAAVSKSYLNLFLQERTQAIKAAGHGVSMAHMTKEKMEVLPVALPPLAEQHRIVAKVDELMAFCGRLEARQRDAEAAQARLVQVLLDSLTQARAAEEFQASWQWVAGQFESLLTTDANVARLETVVLHLAVSGRLVPQQVGDGSADDLLLATEALRKKPRAGRLTPTGSRPDTVRAALPEGWVSTTVGEVLICRDGERVPVSQTDREGRAKLYDYYGASGVIDKIDGFLFDKPLLLVGEDGANLINRSTPIAFIARGKYWVNNHAHVLDGVDEDLLSYMALFFNAIDLKPYVTGTAQPKLNQAKLNAIPVLLPPPGEQRRIVAKVTELLALCDQLKARIAAARAKHAQLAEALVAQAVAA